jgi:hypothetical protein
VLGNPDLAGARKLFVIAAGLPSAVARISPVPERLGQRVFLLGDDAGSANLMKLAANVLTALTLQGMGEVLPDNTPVLICPSCGDTMQHLRTIPKLGARLEQFMFVCPSCEQVETKEVHKHAA